MTQPEAPPAPGRIDRLWRYYERTSASWISLSSPAGSRSTSSLWAASTVHFHCCVIDGVFAVGEDRQIHFAEAAALTPQDLVAVQQQGRTRAFRWFARAGHLDHADARDMAPWDHGGGFSLDASVRIEGADRAGLERSAGACDTAEFPIRQFPIH